MEFDIGKVLFLICIGVCLFGMFSGKGKGSGRKGGGIDFGDDD